MDNQLTEVRLKYLSYEKLCKQPSEEISNLFITLLA